MSAAKRTTTIDHVLKYTGIFGGVQGLNVLISVARSKLATKLLGAAGMGFMGVYLAINEFVTSSSNLGIPFSSVRHISELFESDDAEAIRHFVCVVRTCCLWTSVLACLLCVLCAPLLNIMFFDGCEATTWHSALVAPMAVASIVTGGEISILKGTRRLKRVATISLLSALALLCLTIPIFWLLATDGILLALNVTALATLAIHMAFTLPLFPYRVSPFSASVLRDGWGMIRIGIPYVFAAMAGSGCAMAVSALLLRFGSIEEVGFYRAATAVMVGYAGIVFTALESDFFPRLSSVNHDLIRRNLCINQQVQVCVSLIGPFLIALAVMMPVVLHIIYADEFMIIESMTLAAVFYSFLRAVAIPISYMALAHGDSTLYLIMEVFSDIAMLVLVVGGYYCMGLVGAGAGLSASALFDLLLTGSCYAWHYGFRFERHTVVVIVVQTLFVAAAVATCFCLTQAPRYILGFVVLAVSAAFAVKSLGKDSAAIQRIARKLNIPIRDTHA